MLKKPLLAHLDELLVRGRRSALWLLLGFIVAYVFVDKAVFLLEEPLLSRLPPQAHLVFTTPFEKFWVYMRIAMIMGTILVLPLVGWEIAAFFGPGLHSGERNRVKWLLFSTALVSILGVILGYLYVLPPIINAVLHYGGDLSREVPFLTISSYINAVLGILLLSAIFLEIPVLMFHLSAWGWVSMFTWAKGRRIAFVLNAVLSAILSPPDILSMVVMMIPLQILYECGILGARVAQWRLNDRSKEIQH